ncbi:MAG: hypothetical protein WCI67_19575 [Chloroflexales bacterium]
MGRYLRRAIGSIPLIIAVGLLITTLVLCPYATWSSLPEGGVLNSRDLSFIFCTAPLLVMSLLFGLLSWVTIHNTWSDAHPGESGDAQAALDIAKAGEALESERPTQGQ